MQLLSNQIKNNYKAYLLIGFFVLFTTFSFSQNQRKSDSLKKVLKDNSYDRKDKLRILSDIAYYETDIDEMISYGKELIASAGEMDSLKMQISGYLQIGQAFSQKGDLTTALEELLKGAKIANDSSFFKSQASIKIALADVYSQMGDGELALQKYREGLNYFKKEKDSLNLATSYYNLADQFYKEKELDSALVNYKNAFILFKGLGFENYLAYILGGEGLIYTGPARGTSTSDISTV